MSEIFPGVLFNLARALVRSVRCSLSCAISELGWAEYVLLALVFVLAFALSRKFIRPLFRKN